MESAIPRVSMWRQLAAPHTHTHTAGAICVSSQHSLSNLSLLNNYYNIMNSVICTISKFGVGKSLMLKNVYLIKKNTVYTVILSVLLYFISNVIFLWWQNRISGSLQCHMIHRNHFNMHIWCSFFIIINVENKSSKEPHLSEIEICCNIENVFTVPLNK